MRLLKPIVRSIFVGGMAICTINCLNAQSNDRVLQPRSIESRQTDKTLGEPPHTPLHGTKWTNSIGMEFVFLAPGTFTMGSPTTESGHRADEQEHRVELTNGLWVSTTECTKKYFGTFVDETGYITEAEKAGFMAEASWRTLGESMGPSHPVQYLSWNDVQAFVDWLGGKEKRAYRLPTEAEWEYACRAGTRTAFATGNNLSAEMDANFNGTSVGQLYRGMPVEVQSFPANNWGLYEMHGNVAEWCADWYGPYPSSDEVLANPTGVASGKSRVFRGGAFGSTSAEDCRCARRGAAPPTTIMGGMGFRVVLPDTKQITEDHEEPKRQE